MLNKWKNAIHRDDKILDTNDAVCAGHFLESDIERFYETKMPDGTTHKIERGIAKLTYLAFFQAFQYLNHLALKKEK